MKRSCVELTRLYANHTIVQSYDTSISECVSNALNKAVEREREKEREILNMVMGVNPRSEV